MNIKEKKLLLFGDSIMNGSGNKNYGVGEYLKRDYGITLYKYCWGGARVGYYEGKNWLVDQVRRAVNEKLDPDIILFNGFTNDCHTNTPTGPCDVPLGEMSEGFEGFDIFALSKENTTFSNCFENIADALKKYFPNAKILFIRPHRMVSRRESSQIEYGERAVAICKKWGIPVCDLYKDCDMDTFRNEDRDKYTNDSFNRGYGDGTHPNALGYEEKYMPVIEKAIKALN